MKTMRYHLISVRMAIIKTKIMSIGKNMEWDRLTEGDTGFFSDVRGHAQ